MSVARRLFTFDSHTPSRTDVPSGDSSDHARGTTSVFSRSTYWASAATPRSNAPARAPPAARRGGGWLLGRPDAELHQALVASLDVLRRQNGSSADPMLTEAMNAASHAAWILWGARQEMLPPLFADPGKPVPRPAAWDRSGWVLRDSIMDPTE
ncbi:hypothetical protein ABZ371_28940 [Streptomyces sp. NPDC005899]|uniref:hypothetical protein n=1 Tax=Streptomyces sp. NPDC005899 TaxID=3155716 RepID=UPI0033C0EB9B